jgi:hypothetical protein
MYRLKVVSQPAFSVQPWLTSSMRTFDGTILFPINVVLYVLDVLNMVIHLQKDALC